MRKFIGFWLFRVIIKKRCLAASNFFCNDNEEMPMKLKNKTGCGVLYHDICAGGSGGVVLFGFKIFR